MLFIRVATRTDTDRLIATIALEGELDTVTAPHLQAVLDGCIQAEATDVVLDLQRLQFIDARGLSVLLDARRRLDHLDREMVLRSVPAFTRRVIQAAGLINALGLAPGSADANHFVR